MASPHDALFGAVLGDPEHAASMLRSVLPERVAERIDWASLTPVSASFVDGELAARSADLLFEARVGERTALICFLLEHQSSVDRWMPLRLLEYCVLTWKDWRNRNPDRKRLPAIIPVVLHHSVSGWTTSTRFSDLIDLDDDLKGQLAPHLVDFTFVLDDLARQTDDALTDRALTAVAQLLTRTLKNLPYASDPLAVIGQLMPLMARIWNAPRGRDAIATFLRYFWSASEVDVDDLRTIVRDQLGSTAEDTAMSTADKLIEQGILKGRAEGRVEGRVEGRAATLLKLLQLKFGPQSSAIVDRVNHASIDDLDRWAERILNATSTAETLDP